MSPRRSSNSKRSGLRLSDTLVEELKKYVKEFKCPECKAYVLWIDDSGPGEAWVRCRKCGYSLQLAAFAVEYMGLRMEGDQALIRIPNLYGGEAKEVRLAI